MRVLWHVIFWEKIQFHTSLPCYVCLVKIRFYTFGIIWFNVIVLLGRNTFSSGKIGNKMSNSVDTIRMRTRAELHVDIDITIHRSQPREWIDLSMSSWGKFINRLVARGFCCWAFSSLFLHDVCTKRSKSARWYTKRVVILMERKHFSTCTPTSTTPEANRTHKKSTWQERMLQTSHSGVVHSVQGLSSIGVVWCFRAWLSWFPHSSVWKCWSKRQSLRTMPSLSLLS